MDHINSQSELIFYNLGINIFLPGNICDRSQITAVDLFELFVIFVNELRFCRHIEVTSSLQHCRLALYG